MARTTSTARTPAKRSTSRSATKTTATKTTATKTAAKTQRKVATAATDAQRQAETTVKGQLDERSTQAGEQLSSTAGDVRAIAGQLRSQDNDSAARLADLAADRIDQAATYLSSTSADALISDLEDLARSKPLVAVGAAALAGFAATRALSASQRKRAAA